MSTEAATIAGLPASSEAKKTFAVCFAALVATSFCFILRAFSIDAWGVEFNLSETQYDSARRKLRRFLNKHYPNQWRSHEQRQQEPESLA